MVIVVVVEQVFCHNKFSIRYKVVETNHTHTTLTVDVGHGKSRLEHRLLQCGITCHIVSA